MADQKHPSRRTVIASAAIVPVAALTGSAQQPAPRPSAPTALDAGQLKTLEAFVDHLIPSDELGPGAAAAGAHNYINVQLAGYLAAEKAAFIAGLDGLDAYAKRVHATAFAQLTAAQRDDVLTAMDQNKAEGFQNARNFFNRARRLTLEGTFGDPHYGGNNNGIGWDIIRYPGPRPAVSADQQRLSSPTTAPYRNSAWGAASDHEH